MEDEAEIEFGEMSAWDVVFDRVSIDSNPEMYDRDLAEYNNRIKFDRCPVTGDDHGGYEYNGDYEYNGYGYGESEESPAIWVCEYQGDSTEKFDYEYGEFGDFSVTPQLQDPAEIQAEEWWHNPPVEEYFQEGLIHSESQSRHDWYPSAMVFSGGVTMESTAGEIRAVSGDCSHLELKEQLELLKEMIQSLGKSSGVDLGTISPDRRSDVGGVKDYDEINSERCVDFGEDLGDDMTHLGLQSDSAHFERQTDRHNGATPDFGWHSIDDIRIGYAFTSNTINYDGQSDRDDDDNGDEFSFEWCINCDNIHMDDAVYFEWQTDIGGNGGRRWRPTSKLKRFGRRPYVSYNYNRGGGAIQPGRQTDTGGGSGGATPNFRKFPTTGDTRGGGNKLDNIYCGTKLNGSIELVQVGSKGLLPIPPVHTKLALLATPPAHLKLALLPTPPPHLKLLQRGTFQEEFSVHETSGFSSVNTIDDGGLMSSKTRISDFEQGYSAPASSEALVPIIGVHSSGKNDSTSLNTCAKPDEMINDDALVDKLEICVESVMQFSSNDNVEVVKCYDHGIVENVSILFEEEFNFSKDENVDCSFLDYGYSAMNVGTFGKSRDMLAVKDYFWNF